jgi:cytochrome P450
MMTTPASWASRQRTMCPCPVYPRPSKTRTPGWKFFLKTRRSWLDMLYERSYEMKMGHVRLPGLEVFVVNEPATVRRVLVDEHEQFPKHALVHRMLQPLLGDSIFTTNGAVWKRQRQLLDPAFESTRLKTLFPLMLEASGNMVARLSNAGDGELINVEAEMTHVTADIIFRTILSMSLQEDEARQIYHAFSRFQATALQLSVNQIFMLPPWLSHPVAAWQNREAARDIRQFIDRAVRGRIAKRVSRAAASRDLLDAMLESRLPETGDRYTEGELVDQVCMLFLAGHETSASALSWALYLLALFPDVQTRAREEVRAIVGDRAPAQEDIGRFELIRNVFRETLRLYPPVGFFARESACPTTLRDKAVPQGAAVVISPWLIHRHRKLWQAPDDFNPDRFGTEETRASLKQAYLPFGLGPRICIGAGFALQEATLILAELLRHFRFEYLPEHEPQPVGRLTIRSENGIWLRLSRCA